MKYDLTAVLRNPLRFMAEEYRHALANPRAVPGKALGYAQYDLVRVLNTGLKMLGLHGSLLERVLARTLAMPAARMFRLRRSISVLVAADGNRPGPVEGVYQSPILIQWQRASRDVPEPEVPLYRPESPRARPAVAAATGVRSDAGAEPSSSPHGRGLADVPRRVEQRDAAQHGRPRPPREGLHDLLGAGAERALACGTLDG